jgi:hypothetical protein
MPRSDRRNPQGEQMEDEHAQKRTYRYVRWVAAAACLALFIIPFVDEWAWAGPVLLPFVGIVAVFATGLWFADAARHARRRLKITGYAAVGLVLVLWSISIVSYCSYLSSNSRFIINGGGILLDRLIGSPDEVAASELSLYSVGDVFGWSCGSCHLLRNGIRPRNLGLFLPRILNMDHGVRKVRWLSIHIPFWLPAVISAVPTAWLLFRDRRRIRPGCCRHCGYDLTANVTGICPECGSPIPKETREALTKSSSSTDTTPS